MKSTRRKPTVARKAEPPAPPTVATASLALLAQKVGELDEHLRDAVARKPSEVLKHIAYSLGKVTVELGEVYQQLERNNTAVEALCRQLGGVPTLQPMTAAEVEAIVERRLEAARRRELDELQRQG